MNQFEYQTLKDIIEREPFLVRKRLIDYMATVTPENPSEGNSSPVATRTDNQHKALFLWFTHIEKLAENEGITWNQVVGHTHQLRITKEGLHVMCKQLAEALWNVKSTKELQKQGHIDILIDHFVDLFSKVGLELPPFPNESEKSRPTLEAMNVEKRLPDYPEDIYDGKAGDFGETVIT